MSDTKKDLLRLDALFLSKCVRTDDGFLKAPAVVTRAGIFEYRQADGTMRRELRRPEQVFRADSMATLHNIPFVDGHPYQYGGLVNAKNSRALQRGYTSAPAYKDDQDRLCIDVIVTDEEMIKKIEGGKAALSSGYRVDTLEVPGVWEGKPYDAEQVNIRHNHIAGVNRGRAGQDAALRLDEALNEIIPQEEHPMSLQTIKLDDGRSIQVEENVAVDITRLIGLVAKEGKRADDAEALFLEADKAKETLTGTVEGLQKRLDAAEDPKHINALVKERAALVGVAVKFLPKTEHVKLDDMESVAIMQSVIRADAKDPELKFEGMSADRIQGRFDQVVAGAKNRKGSDLGATINKLRSDEAGDPEDGKDTEEKTAEERAADRKKKLTERYKKNKK